MSGPDQGLRAGVEDGVRIDAVFGVQVGQIPALAEMVGSERHHTLAAHRAEPGMRRGMTVQHGDQSGIRGERA